MGLWLLFVVFKMGNSGVNVCFYLKNIFGLEEGYC